MRASPTTPAGPRPDQRSRALLETVRADPQAPRRVGVRAPGGYGKSTLLGELGRVYQRAGVPVLDAWRDLPDLVDRAEGHAVLLADDAQLLGEDRLRELQRLVAADRLSLVLAYRPWPRPPALAELLRPAGPPLTLGPLTRKQTSEHLGAGADPGLVAFVHAQTGGVPRLVDRLAPAVEWPCHEVPLPALAEFRAELDDLDELDRDLRTLLLAAATGVELTGDLLGALLGRDPAATDELLAAARATGLLGPDGRLLPVARRAVAVLSPVAHRIAVWQRLAELHRAGGDPVLPLVRSLREAGVDGAGLAGVFETAADEALADQPALAAELYAAAAVGRPAGASHPATARRALAAALAGDLDLGLRLADPLIAADSVADRDRAAGAAVAAAALAHRGQLGRSAELHHWSGTATSVAFATVGWLGTGQPDRADLPPPDGPPTLLASAAALLASGIRHSVAGSPTAALSTLVQAAALLEPAGRAVLLPDSPAALAALVALHSGELDLGESVLERAIAVELGAQLMSRRHQLLQAWIRMVRGRTAAAAEQRAAAVTGRLEPRDLLFATALEVGIARRNSDLAGLHRSWGPAREAVLRHPVDLFTLLPLGELAVAAARLGEPGRLTPHLQEAQQLLGRLGDPPLWMAPLHWHGLHAAILAEQPAVADEHVAALTASAGHSRFGSVLAAAGQSWLAVLRGTVDPDAVEAAARGLHGAGLWWDAARLAGQAAIRTPDRRAMTSLLDCARVLQGRPPGSRRGSGPAGSAAGPEVDPAASAGGQLSAREQEVASLLLDGLTYKQIGDRLFISAKTVEHHVARMRQRLGCPSRGELLARLRAIAADLPGGEPIRHLPRPRRSAD